MKTFIPSLVVFLLITTIATIRIREGARLSQTDVETLPDNADMTVHTNVTVALPANETEVEPIRPPLEPGENLTVVNPIVSIPTEERDTLESEPITVTNTTTFVNTTDVGATTPTGGFISGLIESTFGLSCLNLENCQAYVVNERFGNYGCMECKPGYVLDRDQFGSGVCKNKVTIPNCLQEEFLTGQLRSICIVCNQGFILNQDGLKCIEAGNEDMIENCRSHVAINDRLVCNRCISGFTLSDDLTSCEPECDIENCDQCIQRDDKSFCLKCKEQFLAVGKSNMPGLVESCISCAEWAKNLFTGQLFMT